MCSIILSWNSLTNLALFPGSYLKSSYDVQIEDECVNLLSIPVEQRIFDNVCFCLPVSIPAILVNVNKSKSSTFCIHFHANGCDAGSIVRYAKEESREFNCYYLIVEYANYGLGLGLPSEVVLNTIARSIWTYVENSLLVEPSRIVLIGRSVGTGPVTYLASHMESLGKKPAALILHSPYSSIRNAGARWVGIISLCMMDRWQNWKYLCGGSTGQIVTIVTCPVLFIHADNDRIIDKGHSEYMHAGRIQAGYPSQLFIQNSTSTMIKVCVASHSAQ